MGSCACESNDTGFPLELTVSGDTGGITGLFPTVAIRRVSPAGYLDFSDHTFKTSGWAAQYAAMTDLGRGHYQYLLNVSQLALAAGAKLVAEYHVDDGSGVVGDDSDTLIIQDLAQVATFLRKSATNRMEETGGNPGHLVLYDDDQTTPIMVWPLRDEGGGAVLPTVGSPAQRGAGIP